MNEGDPERAVWAPTTTLGMSSVVGAMGSGPGYIVPRMKTQEERTASPFPPPDSFAGGGVPTVVIIVWIVEP